MLDFHPVEGFKFWETVELILETKFVQVVASYGQP
jgi:hypothetical protein